MVDDEPVPDDEAADRCAVAASRWVIGSAGASLLGDQLQVPRFVLILAALARAMLIPGLFIGLGTGKFWVVYPVQALLGVVSAFYYPADMSMLPTLGLGSIRLQRANAVLQMTIQAANTVGPAVGGVVVAVIGGRSSLLGAAGAYLAAALLLVLLRSRPSNLSSPSPTPTDSADPSSLGRHRALAGFTYVAKDRALSALLGSIAILNICTTGLLAVGLPSFVRLVLHAPARVYGIADASFALGGIVGAASLRVITTKRPGRSVLIAAVGLLLFLGLVAAVEASWQLAAAVGVAGVCSGVANVLLITQIQTRAPGEAMARVMSVVMLASLGLAPVAQVLAGAIADAISVRALFIILSGAGLLITAVVAKNLTAVVPRAPLETEGRE